MRVGTSRLMVCAVAGFLAGCGSDPKPQPEQPKPAQQTVIQPGAPGEPSRKVVATPTPAGFGSKHVDVEFMQGMIHHHQQALTMVDWVDDRSTSQDLPVMAERMSASQESEIAMMRDWLTKRGVDPDDHSHMHASMPGMLPPSQLRKLKAARGQAFDRLFLRYMTQHHMGALTMVQELIDKGGGVEPEIEQFILHVDSDQSIEIGRMQQMLRKL